MYEHSEQIGCRHMYFISCHYTISNIYALSKIFGLHGMVVLYASHFGVL